MRCCSKQQQAHAPQRRALDLSNDAFAVMMGLTAGDIRETPLWVNTGNEQLVAPLASADAVRLCRPDTARMAALTANGGIYVGGRVIELGVGSMVL